MVTTRIHKRSCIEDSPECREAIMDMAEDGENLSVLAHSRDIREFLSEGKQY